MSFYSKYLIGTGIIGFIGIPIFILNDTDLSWDANKESYWGMISMLALIFAILVYNLASKRDQGPIKPKN